jgi:hypothetical protein
MSAAMSLSPVVADGIGAEGIGTSAPISVKIASRPVVPERLPAVVFGRKVAFDDRGSAAMVPDIVTS